MKYIIIKPNTVDIHKKNSNNINPTMLFFDFFIRNEAQIPVKIPIINGSKTIPTIAMGDKDSLPFTPLITDITVKNCSKRY